MTGNVNAAPVRLTDCHRERVTQMKYFLPMMLVCGVFLTACNSIEAPAWMQPKSSQSLDGTDNFDLGPTGLPMSTQQRFPDVPLPANVVEDRERSFVYESTDVKIGRMVYTTKATVAEIAQFYIREAPAASWTPERVMEANGAELLFVKPGKRLTVAIEDLGTVRGRRLILLMVPTNTGGSSF